MPPLPPRLKLAADHIDAGRLESARAVLQRFLSSEPDHPMAHGMLGFVLARLGDPARALYNLERAAAANPVNPDALANLGNARLSTADAEGAITAYRRGLAASPGHLSCTVGLINALNALLHLGEADQLGKAAMVLHPDHYELLLNRAATLVCTARADEAIPLLRRAVALRPDDATAASSLAVTMNYASGLAPADIAAAHARYGSLLERAFPRPAVATPATRDSDPDRPLRIGLISADLRDHAVGQFIEPWLAGHDRSHSTVTCYSTSPREDAGSDRLRRLVSRWRSVPHLHAGPLADLVRSDRIDILIDLSGLTAGHRLPVLALRSATVQVTYLGYPNSTGLRACDARIVDSLTDPESAADTLAVERLLRLDPCFLCYRPPDDAPAPSPPAFESGAGITFGSFNSLQKFNDHLLTAWARVLTAAPGSRLVLKAREFRDQSVRDEIVGRISRLGVEPGRLQLLAPTQSLREHLGAYSLVDIALDTFPYAGTTTTCEALAMGVPVVTLAGELHAGRVGVSLLSAIGLPDLIAADTESYIRTAAALADNRPRLSELRRTLRARLLSSPLGDTQAFAARFDAALRDLWRHACGKS